MLAALRNRNVVLLWCGGLISSLGDWLLIIAFPFYVYQVTGSTLATGTMFVAEMIPSLALGSLAGVFVDRWDRRRTMVAADLARAAVLLPLLAFHSSENLWIVYVIAVAQSAISKFFGPAKGALIPSLATERELTAVNSLLGIGDEFAMLVGAPLGGALLGVLGLGDVIQLDSASFLVSALMVAFVRQPVLPVRKSASSGEEPAGRVRALRELMVGFRIAAKNRMVRAIFVIESTALVGQGLIVVLWVIFFQNVLRGDAFAYGSVQTAVGVGSVTGGFLIGALGRRVPPWIAIGLSGMAVGALLLATFDLPTLVAAVGLSAPILPIILALQVIGGIPSMWQAVSERTLLQESVTDEFRGRVFGTFGTVSSLSLLVGSVLASTLGDRLGVVALLNLAGCLYFVAGVAGVLLLPGASREAAGAFTWHLPS